MGNKVAYPKLHMFYWVTNTGEIGCTENPAIEPLIYGIKGQYNGTNPIEFIILTETNAYMFGDFNNTDIDKTSVDKISLGNKKILFSNKDDEPMVYYIDTYEKGKEIVSPLTYLPNNIANLDKVAVIFPNIDKNKAFALKYDNIKGFDDIEQIDDYARLYDWFKSNGFRMPFYDNEFLFIAIKGKADCNVFSGGSDELAISIKF